jgi:4-carboxymuconolactone decarboxylase
MSMSRLAPVVPAEMSTEQRELFEAIAGGRRARGVALKKLLTAEGGLHGPFNAWLHAPAIGMLVQRLGEKLRFEGALTDRQREIAILCVAALWRSEFEWWAHARIARECGLEEEIIEAIAARDRPPLEDEAEGLVHDLTRAVLDDHRVSETLYESAVAALGAGVVVELVTLVGYYTLVSMTLNVFEVDVPPGETRPFGTP